MTKPTKWHVYPPKSQISLGICPVWSVLLCAQWVAKDQCFFMWTAKTDQTGQKPRLIQVFTGRTGHFAAHNEKLDSCNGHANMCNNSSKNTALITDVGEFTKWIFKKYINVQKISPLCRSWCLPCSGPASTMCHFQRSTPRSWTGRVLRSATSSRTLQTPGVPSSCILFLSISLSGMKKLQVRSLSIFFSYCSR